MTPKEKISRERFNEMLAARCQKFGVTAMYGADDCLRVSGGAANVIGEQTPNCTEVLNDLLLQYELSAPNL